MHTWAYRATGMHAQCPLKPFVLQIYTVLPLFSLPISSLLHSQCRQCRAYSSRTRLGSFPFSLCHQNSQRYTSLAASLQPTAFFFPSVRDSCSCSCSRESSLRICWIPFSVWEVWAAFLTILEIIQKGCYHHIPHALRSLHASCTLSQPS